MKGREISINVNTGKQEVVEEKEFPDYVPGPEPPAPIDIEKVADLLVGAGMVGSKDDLRHKKDDKRDAI
jgi:hypothetical protein